MTQSLNLGSLREALRSPIARLLERGDIIEVIQGKLNITAKSGRPVPHQWIREYSEGLLADITLITGQEIFIYHDYSLGQYGPHKSETLTLQFTNLKNMSDAFAAFNVSLKRQRVGRNKEPKGSPLPKGEFSPPKAGEFVKLWKRTGLKDHNPSRLCRYMGNLKGFAYIASYSATSTASKKLANKSIDLLNVTYEDLVTSLPNSCLSHAQDMPKLCLSPMPKESAQRHILQGLDSHLSAGKIGHGLRLQGSAVKGLTHTQSTDNTNNIDDWLNDYDKADGSSPI